MSQKIIVYPCLFFKCALCFFVLFSSSRNHIGFREAVVVNFVLLNFRQITLSVIIAVKKRLDGVERLRALIMAIFPTMSTFCRNEYFISIH